MADQSIAGANQDLQPPSLPHSLSSPMSAGRKTDTARISASASRGYA
jgi:hypothetical protein